MIKLDVAFRGSYFNIYYCGNSLAKVEFRPGKRYRNKINSSFYRGCRASRYPSSVPLPLCSDNKRMALMLSAQDIYPFFKKSHLDDFCARIKSVSNTEEIMLAQVVITDNQNRDDLVLIDHQVQESQWKERMDLLTLEQVDGENHRFRVLEVKLGELALVAAGQLQRYLDHITTHFDDYKECSFMRRYTVRETHWVYI